MKRWNCWQSKAHKSMHTQYIFTSDFYQYTNNTYLYKNIPACNLINKLRFQSYSPVNYDKQSKHVSWKTWNWIVFWFENFELLFFFKFDSAVMPCSLIYNCMHASCMKLWLHAGPCIAELSHRLQFWRGYRWN